MQRFLRDCISSTQQSLLNLPVGLPVPVRTIKAFYIRVQGQHISAGTTFKAVVGVGRLSTFKNAEIHLSAPVAAKGADHAKGISS